MFFEKAIEEFGIKPFPVKDLIEFGKSQAANSNPGVRDSATPLFVILYKFVGKDLLQLIKDIKRLHLPR